MLTVNTKIIKRGTFYEKAKNFIDRIFFPQHIGLMKSWKNKMDSIKNDSCIGSSKIAYHDKCIVFYKEFPEICYKDENDPSSKYIKITDNDGNASYEDILNDKGKYRLFRNDTWKEGYYMVYWNDEKFIKIKRDDINPLYTIINLSEYRKYRVQYYFYRFVINRGHDIYKFFHCIDSCILCMRFPFLYTRNRYNNWNITNLSEKYKKKGILSFVIKKNKNEEYPVVEYPDFPYVSEKYIDSKKVSYFVYNEKEYTLSSGVMKYPITVSNNGEKSDYIYDEKHGFVKFGNSDIEHIFNDGESDTIYCNIRMNSLYVLISKFLKWFNDVFLNIIFFIPTYSEFDSFPEGWKRAFGIDMMKEVKNELIKNKYLYKFRITQIKEKYGTIRFYYNAGTEELSNIVNRYENKSFLTCISCGEKAKYITNGWICPYCENCISEYDKSSADIYDENGKLIKENEKF